MSQNESRDPAIHGEGQGRQNHGEEQLLNDMNAEQMLMDEVLPESPAKGTNNNKQFSSAHSHRYGTP